jgi:Zn-dependent peptidase ImmA (M78 family)
VDVEGHLTESGVRVADIELSDAGTAGLAGQPEGGAPHVLVNRRNPKCQFPSGLRFILAHELGHLLHDRAQGQSLAMISGPWAPRELGQRANAFAAALLMPADLLRKAFAVSGNQFTFDLLLGLAKRFRVSTDALAHHLANMGLIDETTRDGLNDFMRPLSTQQERPNAQAQSAVVARVLGLRSLVLGPAQRASPLPASSLRVQDERSYG